MNYNVQCSYSLGPKKVSKITLPLSITLIYRHTHFSPCSRKSQKKGALKKIKNLGGGVLPNPKPLSEGATVFKSYDKSSGISLRSSKLKFPLTLGQKKTKTVEQVLEELGVG